MTTISQNLTSNIPINIDLVSLSNTGIAVSSPIDNSIDLYIDADIQIMFKTGASVSGTGTLDLYLLRCIDGLGVTYDDVGTSSTLISQFPAILPATVQIVSSSIDVLPSRWKLMIINNTGGSLDSSVNNFNVIYEGKKLSVN